MRVIWPTHLHHNYVLILIICAVEYKSLNFSLCNFLQPYGTSSLLGPDIFLSTLFSNTLNLRSCLIVRDLFHVHIKQQANYSFVHVTITDQTTKRVCAESSFALNFVSEINYYYFFFWLPFPRNWTLPSMWRIYYLTLWSDFGLHSVEEIRTHTLFSFSYF